MLEIFMLVWLTRKLSRMAEERGQSRGWAALGPVFWIAGEILGFVIGFAMGMDMAAVLLALACAAGGAGIAYAIVARLAPKPYSLARGPRIPRLLGLKLQ